ncbi:DUF7093 family protein [Natrarchaeobaculum aegyptiacum]|uniref:Uncharacterized protein n=1 Tax=Natrarchaeobaculum aegyptiacum TaxID=745377 RepID=A0A2Z2HTK3_9EURY|nr:hypothetical protein [Natrarchaeobaculum aegyptiacum]ARS90123.1 hypothetical protein B1756_10545 [Natrarchaeobaculum aegyptiacum]
MVLRCSLLGHDYGEPDVEREREERGSEVVVTVQEYEECSRCGDRNVLSENTEVRSLSGTSADGAAPPRSESDAEAESTADDQPNRPDAARGEPSGAEAGAGGGASAGSESESTADPAPETTGEDAEILDAEDDASGGVTIPDAETNGPVEARPDPDGQVATDDAVSADHPSDADGEPVTDDGEILEPADESTDDDRAPGAWPDSSDVGPPVDRDGEPTTWPDPEADSDGMEATGDSSDEPGPVADDPAEEQTDAVVLEHTDPTETGADAIATDSEIVDAGPTGPEPDQEPDSSGRPSLSTGSGIERADSVPTPGETPARRTDDVQTEYYCPRCEFVEPDGQGSLRPGDICPDCRKGYLGERPVQ